MSATYTGLTDEGAVLVAKWQNWQPPKGHPSWCRTQVPPFMAVTGRKCSCAKSATAKGLQKLRALGACS